MLQPQDWNHFRREASSNQVSCQSEDLNLFVLNLLYRCLAHIINLATQAVISTRSKSKYYSGDPEDDGVPENMGTGDRDEIGIVRAICVKVRPVDLLPLFTLLTVWLDQARSSSQRKQLFKTIQERINIRPCQLLLDMKVRWSSTYVMLTRAESRRQVGYDSFFLLCVTQYT